MIGELRARTSLGLETLDIHGALPRALPSDRYRLPELQPAVIMGQQTASSLLDTASLGELREASAAADAAMQYHARMSALMGRLIDMKTGPQKVRLMPGTWWMCDLRSGDIYYPILDMMKRSEEESIALIFHELGHQKWSRITAEVDQILSDVGGPETLERKIFMQLWNAIEDPRINNLQMDLYPGVRNYFADLYRNEFSVAARDKKLAAATKKLMAETGCSAQQAQATVDRSRRVQQFGTALIYRWQHRCFEGGEGWAPWIKDEHVVAALQRCERAIDEATERAHSGSATGLTEARARQLSTRCVRIIKNQIWPEVLKLLELDLKDVEKEKSEEPSKGSGSSDPSNSSDLSGQPPSGEAQPGDPSGESQARKQLEQEVSGRDHIAEHDAAAKRSPQTQSSASGSPSSSRSSGEAGPGAGAGAESADPYKKLLSEVIRRNRESRSAGEEPASAPTPSEPAKGDTKAPGTAIGELDDPRQLAKEVAKSDQVRKALRAHQDGQLKTDYLRRRKRLGRAIEALKSEFLTIFGAAQKPTWDQARYASGKKVDRKAYLRSINGFLSGRPFNPRVMMRRQTPTEPSVVYVLIVDVSDSMDGAMEGIKDTIVQLGESAAPSKIPNAIIIFADDARITKSLEANLSDEELHGLISDAQLSGVGSGTDDLKPLRKAATMLAGRPEQEKVIFVASDGDGGGADTRDFANAIRNPKAADPDRYPELRNWRGPGIRVFGIGVNGGDAKVEQTYGKAYSIRVPDSRTMPKLLGKVLRSVVQDAGRRRGRARNEAQV
ncbi:MAG: vWA domain-containing protein [Myxococcota bacterium]